MAEFTQEDKDYLYQVFADKDHEVREGNFNKDKTKVQWYIYLKREVIIRHLDARFFGEWENTYHGERDLTGYSEVYCRISIRGIARENNGANSGNAGNDGKGAATDAFKRAAQNWGIGLYLNESIMVWTDYDYVDGKKTDYKKREQRENEALSKFYGWLRTLRGGQAAQSSNGTTKPAPHIVKKQDSSLVEWPDDSGINFNEKTNRRKKVFEAVKGQFDNNFTAFMNWCDAQGVTWALSSEEIIENIELLQAG